MIVRLSGEAALKRGLARRQCISALIKCIRNRFVESGLHIDIEAYHAHLLLYIKEPLECEQEAQVSSLLSRIFGVGTFSICLGTGSTTLDAICEKGHALFANRIQGQTFAVHCHRNGSYSFGTMDVKRALGARLNPYGKVHLDSPDINWLCGYFKQSIVLLFGTAERSRWIAFTNAGGGIGLGLRWL